MKEVERVNWILKVRKLVHAPRVRDWCKLPYPNHPHGCPNYGQNKHRLIDGCPPYSCYVTEKFDVDRPLYIVFSEFDLQAYVYRKKLQHPNRTDKQVRCVLYWQGISKAQLRRRFDYAVSILKTDAFAFAPESLGVNVYVTCLKSGLKLEPIKKLKLCRHIALLGWRR